MPASILDAEGEQLDAGSGRQTLSRRSGADLGQTLGGSYRIVRPIGAGGSGQVFEAEHLRLGKSFALKLLRPDIPIDVKAAERFRREAKAIARVESEHVVSIVDCGELADGTPFLVTELLQGQDLRHLVEQEGALPPRRALQLALEACRGLCAVHAAGLVHRDLKPANLFVTRRATGEDWCKILDFGVAKMQSTLTTAQGAIVGTVRYMAPEQLDAASEVGPRTDLYALGAILYECLAGRPLHDGDSVQQVMYRIMNVEPVPLHSLCRTLPDSVSELVMRCLSRSIAERPSSAAQLARELERVTAGDRRRLHDATLSETRADDGEVPAIVPALAQSVYVRHPLLTAALVGSVGITLGWTLASTGASQAKSTVARNDPSPQPSRAAPGATGGTAEVALTAAPIPAPATPSEVTTAATSSASRVEASGVALTHPVPTAAMTTRHRPTQVRAAAPAAPVASTATPGDATSLTMGRLDAVNPYDP